MTIPQIQNPKMTHQRAKILLGLIQHNKSKFNQKELSLAFRKKSLLVHPDRNRDNPQATQAFQELVEAKDYLIKDIKIKVIIRGFGAACLILGLAILSLSVVAFIFAAKMPILLTTLGVLGILVSVLFLGVGLIAFSYGQGLLPEPREFSNNLSKPSNLKLTY
ncbi:MAG: J domain-containing protein [Gammaproteobacteria bacterium]|nr:J domain-containing protein [Gammaproteobacteria bacterium]